MASHNKRPIIFPLSNPVSLCEVEYDAAVKWTEGKVVFASGSPYEQFEWEGKTYEPGQGNNMYIFPGIGLGTVLSKARHVTDEMVEAASIALSSSLNEAESTAELVYPRLERIREISGKIALAVIKKAQEQVSVYNPAVSKDAIVYHISFIQGLDETTGLRHLSDDALGGHIRAKMWEPSSEPLDRRQPIQRL